MQLYFAKNLEENFIQLDEAESYHISVVLRHKINNEICLTDGKGKIVNTKIISINKNNVTVEKVENIEHNILKNEIHLAVSLIKNSDRFEYMLEKITEIGVGIISPLICNRTERKTFNYDRMLKIIQSAAKQSKNVYFPMLNKINSFDAFVEQNNKVENKYIMDLNTKKTFKDHKNLNKILMIIGPEGDFTQQEIEKAKYNNFESISLGNSVLRVETAAIAAIGQVNFINL